MLSLRNRERTPHLELGGGNGAPLDVCGPCDWSQLIVAHGGGDTIAQIIVDYSTAFIYVRSGNPSDTGGTGNWTNWRKFVSSEDFSYSNGTLTITM